MCEKCKVFFSKFTCESKLSHALECDCPKCQGLCADLGHDLYYDDDEETIGNAIKDIKRFKEER
jgi:hypothetical protein